MLLSPKSIVMASVKDPRIFIAADIGLRRMSVCYSVIEML